MRFNKGDKFIVWMLNDYAWLDITSYKNDPNNWTLEELKKSLYDQMVETGYVVEQVGLFKVKLSYWGNFHVESSWFSKRLVNKWLKNNYSKDALWLIICRDILKSELPMTKVTGFLLQ